MFEYLSSSPRVLNKYVIWFCVRGYEVGFGLKIIKLYQFYQRQSYKINIRNERFIWLIFQKKICIRKVHLSLKLPPYPSLLCA